MSNHQCPTCDRNFAKKSHLINHLNKKFKCQSTKQPGSQQTNIGLQLPPNILQTPVNGSQPPINGLQFPINSLQTPMAGIQFPQAGLQFPYMIFPFVNNNQYPIIDNQIPITQKEIPMQNNEQIINNQNPITQKEIPVRVNEKTIDNEFRCNHCNGLFARNNALRRHMKYYCKDKLAEDNKIAEDNKNKQELFEKLILVESEKKQCEEEVIKLKNEIKALQSSITINNNSNNNTINNTININIASHGQEDLGNCTESFLVLAAQKGLNGVLTLTEWVHFNDRFPEFQNIYIPDIKNKHVMVFDKVWQLKNADDVIAKLYDNKSTILNDNKEFLFNHLSEPQKKVYTKWEKYNNERETPESKIFMKEAHEKIKLLLYNKKDMVIATRKRYELKKTTLLLNK